MKLGINYENPENDFQIHKLDDDNSTGDLIGYVDRSDDQTTIIVYSVDPDVIADVVHVALSTIQNENDM